MSVEGYSPVKSEQGGMEKQENPIKIDREKLLGLGLLPDEVHQLEEPDKGGATGLVYFIEKEGKKMVIKKGLTVDPDLNARREYTFLRLLRMRGGKKVAPDPYYYNLENNLLIAEEIEGESVSELSDEDITKIAGALGRVHKPEFSKPGIPFKERKEATQYDNLIKQVNFLEDWFAQLSDFITSKDIDTNEDVESRLGKAKDIILQKISGVKKYFDTSSFSLIHYDLNPGNIFKGKEGNVLFLDWRQASIGDRAMDVAKLFYKNYLNKEQQEIFFDAYSREIQDPTIRQRTEVYYPLIRLASILWRFRFLNIDTKEHPEITKHVNLDLVRERLKDDYEYIISTAGLNSKK